jgi:hypothetical protein
MDEDSMTEVNQLLKTLGLHLEDLHIGKICSSIVPHFSADGQYIYIYLPHTEPTDDGTNLAHNTHLCHISLLITYDESTFTLLSQITSSLVEHVLLAIYHSFDVDRAWLDRFLTQQRWANLQRLSVREFRGMTAKTAKLIRSRLPILESCGVVLDLEV